MKKAALRGRLIFCALPSDSATFGRYDRTTPSSGELAVAYSFLDMRPARYAERPACTANLIASAIRIGS